MHDLQSRRQFFSRGGHLLGGAALASLLGESMAQASGHGAVTPHFAPRAKRVIYLHMVGGPSQMDLFDYKPAMKEWYDKDLPESIRKGQRLTTMTSGQTRFPIAPSKFKFEPARPVRHVDERSCCRALSKMVDDICCIRSMHTEAINHEPAITVMQTGNQVAGRPCLGSWVSYGLGALNENLPTFVVLVATPTNTRAGAGDLRAALGVGLPARRARRGLVPQQRRSRSSTSTTRPASPRASGATIARRPQRAQRNAPTRQLGDPETHTRIEQYEMAFRMQASVPELTDIASEPRAHLRPLRRGRQEARHLRQHRADGPPPGRARRPLRPDLPPRLGPARQPRRPHAEPVQGRRPALLRPRPGPQAARACSTTRWSSGAASSAAPSTRQGSSRTTNYGRDHHPRCFTMWMAGGGVKGGHDLRRDRRLLLQHRQATRSTSATSTPPSSTSSASTTSASPTASRASTRSSPASSRRVIPELIA